MLKKLRENLKLINPFEVAMGIMFFLSGLGLLIAAPAPMSVVSVFPALVRWLWASVIATGGGLKLLGFAFNNIPLRRAGLVLMGGASTAYVLALIAFSGIAAFFPICLNIAVAWACWAMFWRLR